MSLILLSIRHTRGWSESPSTTSVRTIRRLSYLSGFFRVKVRKKKERKGEDRSNSDCEVDIENKTIGEPCYTLFVFGREHPVGTSPRFSHDHRGSHHIKGLRNRSQEGWDWNSREREDKRRSLFSSYT